MKNLILIISLGVIPFLSVEVSAQVDTCYSISEGLKTPEEIIRLKISNEDKMLDSLTKFVNLEFLQLDNFYIDVAPVEIGKLTWLRTLEISNSKFVTLPKSYSLLTNLEEVIFLNDSQLNLQQGLSMLNGAKNLRILRIEGFNLEQFPTQITHFKHLESLSLRNDHLRSLPDEMKMLKDLQILDLGQNEFDSIPGLLSAYPNLHTLFLDNEEKLVFNSSFKTLEEIPKLRELHLEGNLIDQRKFSSINMLQLERLYMNDLVLETESSKLNLNLGTVQQQPDVSKPFAIPVFRNRN